MKKIKKYFKETFPHIPFTLLIVLSITVVIIISIEYLLTKTFSGIGFNIATEIIGILITLMLVDFYVQKNREKEWNEVHRNVKASILGLLMGFDYLFLFLEKKIANGKDKKIYQKIFNNFDEIYSSLSDGEFKDLIMNANKIIEENINSIISYINLNPKPEYLNELITIRFQTDFLSSWTKLKDANLEFSTLKQENSLIIKSFKAIVWNLSKIDKKLLFEYIKIKPLPAEFIFYIASNKAMKILKVGQEVRDIILEKYSLKNL